uniref:ADF-H domain-containing protein n=1 Tax=Ciona savignyi TaxID=51511 RepID=H2YM30_CIOSA
MSGIKFDPASEPLCTDFKKEETKGKKKEERLLARFFCIEQKKKIVWIKDADIKYSEPDCFKKFQKYLLDTRICYALLNVSYDIASGNRESLAAVYWSGEGSCSENMIYSSTFDVFKNKSAGKDKFELHDKDDIELSSFIESYTDKAKEPLLSFCNIPLTQSTE